MKSWLFTILNLENVRLSKRYHPVTVELGDPVMANESTLDDERNADRQSLQQAIMQLPLNYREPLLLQVIGGFTINEIAEILDVKLSTVLKRLFRARNKLVSTYSEKSLPSMLMAMRPGH